MRRARRQEGQALIEMALTIPILLLLGVGILEFGRAYQTWQILTNAAREGARLAILPGADPVVIEGAVRNYMQNGQLPDYASDTTTVEINTKDTIVVNGVTVSASRVTVTYPFAFIALKPVAALMPGTTTLGNDLSMQATAIMRNER